MQQQQLNYYSPADELDEELTIDLKKIFFAIWSRKELIIKTFASVFAFFILMTFIAPKKYLVDADLYINKANNTNLVDINPYAIEELGAGGGMAALMSGGGSLTNELELMKSPLVIDRVIKENDIRYKKVFGIFPTKKTGQYVKADKFIKKLNIENKKGTNVVSISFKAKKKELAYGVVSSIVKNYIELHKEIHQEKSKSDKQILEKEYTKAKAELESKINKVGGLPSTAMTGAGNITAMSAFSKSAQLAMTSMQSQYIAGEKSKLEVSEDAAKVAQLSSKLEWAKLVDEMSDSSKVLILKEPQMLQDYEQVSPKLFTQIILGIVFGVIAALFAVIYREITDKKLAYSMLGDEIIYNVKKDFTELKIALLTKKEEKISFVAFEKIEPQLIEKLSQFRNINFVKADISEEFINSVKSCDSVIIVSSIGNTDAKLYKQIKEMLKQTNKPVIKDILV